jgi:Phenylpropionate dioxygenase and related ring-hydroxylating dioxygenases, large terminal subunit
MSSDLSRQPAPLPRQLTYPEAEWRALARFWYPIAYADELDAGKPLARTLLDEPLIAYRTTGRRIVVARDLCIHRGVPLHLGWQEGDELVCAYHGFRYGADGRCTAIPAQPDLPVPKKLCLSVVASVEHLGLVWVCLDPAPGAAPALPDWPQLSAPAYRMMHAEPQEWACTPGRQLENFIDVAHFSWIHTGTFGNRDQPEVPPYEVERTATGFRVDYRYLASNPASAKTASSTGEVIQRRMLYDLHLPFACRLDIDYGDGRHHCVFDLPTPVSRRRSRIFHFVARNFDPHIPAEEILAFELKVLAEDKPMVESQRPEDLPLDLSEEFHIRCDRFSAAFRGALRELGLGPDYTK